MVIHASRLSHATCACPKTPSPCLLLTRCSRPAPCLRAIRSIRKPYLLSRGEAQLTARHGGLQRSAARTCASRDWNRGSIARYADAPHRGAAARYLKSRDRTARARAELQGRSASCPAEPVDHDPHDIQREVRRAAAPAIGFIAAEAQGRSHLRQSMQSASDSKIARRFASPRQVRGSSGQYSSFVQQVPIR
jgi:hypothetical protein